MQWDLMSHGMSLQGQYVSLPVQAMWHQTILHTNPPQVSQTKGTIGLHLHQAAGLHLVEAAKDGAVDLTVGQIVGPEASTGNHGHKRQA